MRVLLIWVLLIVVCVPQGALAWGPEDFFQLSLAFLTNLAVHESGHYIAGQAAGAPANSVAFFSERDGSFFLGLSTVGAIEERFRVVYILGGHMATGLTFEIALQRYRRVPTTYNRSLLLISGSEWLWYSLYAFYLAPQRDIRHDPVGLSEMTGLKPEAIVMAAAIQSLLNAYRFVSGTDRMFPYFTFDGYSAFFMVGVRY